jgi:hypothetical protein
MTPFYTSITLWISNAGSSLPYTHQLDAVWYLHKQRKDGVCPKLQPQYIGPCVILKKYNDLVYCVQLSQEGLIKVLNHDKLKPYLGPHYPKWAWTDVLGLQLWTNTIFSLFMKIPNCISRLIGLKTNFSVINVFPSFCCFSQISSTNAMSHLMSGSQIIDIITISHLSFISSFRPGK